MRQFSPKSVAIWLQLLEPQSSLFRILFLDVAPFEECSSSERSGSGTFFILVMRLSKPIPLLSLRA